jgi:hypothetical protein
MTCLKILVLYIMSVCPELVLAGQYSVTVLYVLYVILVIADVTFCYIVYYSLN